MTAEVVGVWAAVMEHASGAEERGDVSQVNAELIGLTLGLETAMVEGILDEFRAVRLLDGDRVAEWERHQNVRVDPTNAQRQRRHRNKESDSNVTARYVTTQDRTGQDTTEQNIQDRTGQHRQGNAACVLENASEAVESPHSSDSAPDVTVRNPERYAGDSDLQQRLADIELGEEAVRIVQEARPGADPARVLQAFKAWAQKENRHARGWKRALQTFAKKERLSDDECRAEQAAIANRIGPRQPGESATDYSRRAQGGPTAPEIADLIRPLARA